MTLRGTIRNGLIEPDHALDLPEGTRVTIELTPSKPARKRAAPSPRTDSGFRIGDDPVPMGVRDLAAQHDHYLYGTPKRRPRKASKPARKTKR